MDSVQLFGAIVVFGTFAVVAVCLILYARIMAKRHYKCPYCGQRFKASSVRTFFKLSEGVDKTLQCPSCGKHGKMEFMHDEDFTDDIAKKELEEHEARKNGEETPGGDDVK